MAHRILWLIAMAIFAAILAISFRAYLNPSFLIDFANMLIC